MSTETVYGPCEHHSARTPCHCNPMTVDALRTRLARAFEVAALRDPSAELAAFEAAVRADERREATDTVAVDREALAKALYDSSADLALTRLGAQAMADAVLASGILRDAAAVRAEMRGAIEAAADAWDNESRGWYYDNRHTHKNGIEWCDGFEDGWGHAAQLLRDLLADNGAAALREVKSQAWGRGVRKAWVSQLPPEDQATEWMNANDPYRNTAGGDGNGE